MTNILPFPPAKESQPEADCVCLIIEDGKAVEWVKFGCLFTAQSGKDYAFNIWARDRAHAESQLAALKSNARVDGQIFAERPA